MRILFGFVAITFAGTAFAGNLDNHFFEANYGMLNGSTGNVSDASASSVNAAGRFHLTPEFDIGASVGLTDLNGNAKESSKLKSEIGYNYRLNEAADLRFSGGVARTRLDDTSSADLDYSETGAVAGLEGNYAVTPALKAEAGMRFMGGDTLGSTDYFLGGTYKFSNNASGVVRYENSAASHSKGIDTNGVSFGVRMQLR